MKTATQILDTLAQLGVTIKAISPDRLEIEPASKVPVDLLPRIREAKAEILAALSKPARDRATGKPCFACGSRTFWRSIYGAVICWRCHPPANEDLVTDILWDGEVKLKRWVN